MLTCSPAFKHAGEYSLSGKVISENPVPGRARFDALQSSGGGFAGGGRRQDAAESGDHCFPCEHRTGYPVCGGF